jgi:hypothetical protein
MIVILAAAVLAYFGQWKGVTVLLALILVAQSLMFVFKAEANKYASAEARDILADQASPDISHYSVHRGGESAKVIVLQ